MTSQRDGIVLDEHQFVVLWCIVCLLRMTTLIVLALYMWYIQWLGQPTGLASGWRRDLHTQDPKIMHRLLLFLCLMFLVHFYKTWELLQASFVENLMVFRPTTSFHIGLGRAKKNTPVGRFGLWQRQLSRAVWRSRFCAKRKWILQVRQAVISGYTFGLGLVRFLGIRSKWFSEVFAIRKSIEIATQAYQVYLMNCLIADDLINTVSLLFLLVSSLTSTVLEMITHDHERKKMTTRFALLLVDTCTDFVFAIVLPLKLQVTFFSSLDVGNMMFIREKYFDSLWFASAIRQFKQFALTSRANIVSLVVFQISLQNCLWKVQSSVNRRDQMTRMRKVHSSWLGSMVSSTSHVAVNDHYQQPMAESTVIESFNTSARVKSVFVKWKTRVFRWLPVVHALVGVIAVAASVVARRVTNTAIGGCHMYGYEWFKPHPVCIVLEINCYGLDISGQHTEISSFLQSIDTQWLFSLMVSHCPALEMPVAIREIPSLYSIEIYNSTLRKWDAQAAITSQTSPQMTYIKFLHTSFSDAAVPEGILAPDFPSGMSQIVFVHTNLRTLPPIAHQRWINLFQLVMDHSKLTEIPWTVTQMRSIESLSLVNNSIANITDGQLDQFQLFRLLLSGNPLRSLPTKLPVAVLANSCRLELEHTLLESVPNWLHQFLKLHAAPATFSCQTTTYGSTICSNRVTRELAFRHGSSSLNTIDWLLSKCLRDFQTTRGYLGLAIAEKQRTPT